MLRVRKVRRNIRITGNIFGEEFGHKLAHRFGYVFDQFDLVKPASYVNVDDSDIHVLATLVGVLQAGNISLEVIKWESFYFAIFDREAFESEAW